jgi:hypothetical protein
MPAPANAPMTIGACHDFDFPLYQRDEARR